MKQPNKVHISPFTYEIQYHDVLRGVDDDSRLHGSHDTVNKIINIWSKQHEEMKKETYIHECLHAMFDVTALDLRGMEESVVTALSPVIMGWIKNNPKTIQWIMEK